MFKYYTEKDTKNILTKLSSLGQEPTINMLGVCWLQITKRYVQINPILPALIIFSYLDHILIESINLPVLHIRRGNRGNLGIISHISPNRDK